MSDPRSSSPSNPTSGSDPAAERGGLDARLLLPATTGWLTGVLLAPQSIAAALLTAAAATGVALALAYVLMLGVTSSGRWRRIVVTGLGVAVVTVGVAIASGLHGHSMRSGPVAELAAAEAAVSVGLVVTGDPAVKGEPGARRPPYVVVRARVERISGRGRTTEVRTPVVVIGSVDWRDVRLGQRIEAAGRLREVEPGGDAAAMLSSRAPPKVIEDPAWWLRAAEHVRAGLRQAVAPEPPEVRGLVPALVMGDDAGLPAEVVDDFERTGLTHLAAVSGTNLTLLLAFVVPLARVLGVRARGLTVVGLLTVVAFVVLARPQPSVLRAAAMGLVALLAMTGGTRRGVRGLSVAVLALLLFDPALARSAGFALSVLATAGILLLAPVWRDALARWLPDRVAEAVACPLAAQLACTPVVAWLSGEVSLVAVGANVLAGPAVGPATVLGFGTAGVALLSTDLARLGGWLAGWPARWILAVATHGADLPGASAGWPATVAGVTVLTLLCVLAGAGLHRVLTRPVAALACAVLVAVVVLRPVGAPGWPPGDWLLVACDVGQGDGLVVRVAPGSAVVVDTGPDPEPMDRCLDDLDVRHVPVLVLSHFHADHAGGLAGAIDGRQVDEIEVGPYPAPVAEHRRVLELAATRGIPVRTASYGERRTAGPVTWSVIWPGRVGAVTPGDSPEGAVANNASVAMMLDTGGVRVLLTGDLEPESQRAVLAAGTDLRADVLKVPHHGSGRQDAGFVAATGARLAIISAGVDNDYGHPAPRTLDLLRHAGMAVVRTDTDGAVAVVRDGTDLATVRSGPERAVRPRAARRLAVGGPWHADLRHGCPTNLRTQARRRAARHRPRSIPGRPGGPLRDRHRRQGCARGRGDRHAGGRRRRRTVQRAVRPVPVRRRADARAARAGRRQRRGRAPPGRVREGAGRRRRGGPGALRRPEGQGAARPAAQGRGERVRRRRAQAVGAAAVRRCRAPCAGRHDRRGRRGRAGRRRRA